MKTIIRGSSKLHHPRSGHTPKRWTWIALLFIAWLTVLQPARAHDCGTFASQVSPGLYSYRITADVKESQPTTYSVLNRGNTNVVVVETPDSFQAFNYGEFILRAVSPGTTTLQFHWFYAPSNAFNDCFVNVNISSTQTVNSAGNYLLTVRLLDPINAFNCELVQQEEPDLYRDGPMPLGFIRYYASHLNRDSVLTEPLGINWSHNFNQHLLRASNRVDVISHRGQRVQFQKTNGQWQLSGSMAVPFQLVEQGGNFVLGDPRDYRLYTFNTNGQLTSIADNNGNLHTLTYTNDTLLQVSDGIGRTLTFQYEGLQTISRVSDGTRSVGFFYFPAVGGELLARSTNAAGGVTQYNYDFANPIAGLLTSKVLPRGNTPYVQQYNSLGRVIRQIAGALYTNNFGYSSNTTTLTNPLAQVTTYVHNTNGALTSLTDATNKTISFTYNAAGQRTGFTDREGRPYTTTLHAPSGKPASASFADGRTVNFSYVARTNATGIVFYYVSQIAFSDGTSDQYQYDAKGNLTNWTDRAGRVITLTYNPRGQPLTGSDASGGTVFFTYNPDGTLATFGPPAGSGFETTYIFDSLRRKTQINRPDGTTMKFQYDALDRVTQITDESTNTTTYIYNANGFVDRIVDALNHTNRLTYDALDRAVALIDPAGNTIGFGYSPLDKFQTFTNRNGEITTLAYDAVGRPVSATNPDNLTRTFGYDAEGLLASVTDPLGGATLFKTERNGVISRFTTPLTNIFRAGYGIFANLTSLTNPVGDVLKLHYDPSELLTNQMVAGVASATYTRDVAGQINGVIDPLGNLWAYPRAQLGVITHARDPLNREIAYTYDVRGRVSMMTFPGGLGSLTQSFTGTDETSRLQYSDGTDLVYQYDKLRRLTNANGITLAYDPPGNITNCNGLAIGRDAAGHMTSVTFAPGRTVSYQYNRRGLVTNVTDWVGGSLSFTYDAADRLITTRRPNGVHTTNTWNADGALTRFDDGALASSVLTLDRLGRVVQANRNLPTSPVLSASTNSWNHDAASQIVGYAYDALGRLTSDTVRTCRWDLASRLTNFTQGATTIVSTFDALNYRLTHVENGVTNACVWNYATVLPTMCVVRFNGGDVRYFIYTPEGELLYSIEAGSGARRFYHFDEVGNTTFLTDAAGSVIAGYAYSPYGDVLGSTGTVANPFTWQGRYGFFREGNTGLYYVRARFYDSVTGRFLSRDPIHSLDPQRINPYQYALGNPQLFIDPTGLDPSVGWGRNRMLAYTVVAAAAALADLLTPRGEPGFFQFFGDETEAYALDYDGNQNSALTPPIISGKVQYGVNSGYGHSLMTLRKRDKSLRLERLVSHVAVNEGPLGRMSHVTTWNTLNPGWYVAGAYFPAEGDRLIERADYGASDSSRSLIKVASRYEIFDLHSRPRSELTPCLLGPPPPFDSAIGGFSSQSSPVKGTGYTLDPGFIHKF